MRKDERGKKEISMLEEELNGLHFELEESYSRIGKKMLEATQKEERKINQIVDEMINKRKKLLKLKHEKACENCMTFNEEENNYCKHCGKKI
ncbi:MAG: hypothetical protein GX786_09355 [Clostridiales bacterium]|nr:hypothetical protein [Clostridiales bacterium]